MEGAGCFFCVSNSGKNMRTALCRLSFHWRACWHSFWNFRFKMPRSERVILHVSINMGRLPSQRGLLYRKRRWANVGKDHSTILKLSFLIEGCISIFLLPGLVEEARCWKCFHEKKVRFNILEVRPVFEEFSSPSNFFENIKSSKYGSCLQLCLWLRSRSSSGSLGNFGKYLVFVKIEHQMWSNVLITDQIQANIYMYLTSGSIPNSSRKIPIGVFFPRPRVSATLVTWKNDKIRFIMRKKWIFLLEQKHSKGGAHQLA